MENELRHVRFKQDSTQVLGPDAESTEIRQRSVRGQSSGNGHISGGIVLQDRTNISSAMPSGTLSSAQRINLKECTTIGELEGCSTHFDQLSTSSSGSPFQTSWSTISYNSSCHHRNSTSTLPTLSGRGTYVCRLSPTCNIAALAINQMEPANTQVLFFSPIVKAGMASRIYQRKVEGNSGRWG